MKHRSRSVFNSVVVHHCGKFPGKPWAQDLILNARSDHAAFKIANELKDYYQSDWYDIRFQIMETILIAKTKQHEYVRRVLLRTNNRILIERSPKDSYWGIGSEGNGQNKLGILWMKLRHYLRRGDLGRYE